MKTLIVREAFSLGADFFPRGAEITDLKVIPQVLESHRSHVIESQEDASPPAPAVQEVPVSKTKSASPAAAAARD